MELIRLNHIDQWQPKDKIFAAIGQFDGLHKGHMRLIDEVLSLAHKHNAKGAVITFDPHPDYILKTREDLGYITPLAKKVRLLEEKGIDYVVVITFDEHLRQMSYQDFFNQFLSQLAGIVVGHDYRYGYKGLGNRETLKQQHKHVVVIDEVCLDNEKIGSNAIRQLLIQGDVKRIYDLMNRYYQISGTVSHGAKIGRLLGVKTANIELDDAYQILARGVYAVRVKLNETYYKGVCNIGINPSVNPIEKNRLEVHILDFSDDIYGQTIEVEFVVRLRDELYFANTKDLVAQIQEDIKKTRLIVMEGV